jgi:hypothetical protein
MWTLSAALLVSSPCSLALGEASSEASCSDGAQFAPSSATPTPEMCSSPAKMTGPSRRSRSGMTYAPSTADHGEAVLTSFLAAFPVRTSAWQGEEPESTAHDQDSGDTWPGSLARYDRRTSSWRTHQLSLAGGSTVFSGTWPRWGTMRDGVCWAQMTPPSRRHTEALRRSTTGIGYGLSPRIEERVPTPTLIDASPTTSRVNRSQSEGASVRPVLAYYVRIRERVPTPTASTGGPEPPGQTGRKLVTHVRIAERVPTPRASDGDKGSRTSQGAEKELTRGRNKDLGMIAAVAGGTLNPTWVEWLMGWPLGWTDSVASATDRFQLWLRSHGGC